MTKLKVFIDFEAISIPFCYEIARKRDIPFAYTLGVFDNKKFKTKTYIINFNDVQIDEINVVLRYQICKDIRNLINNKNFNVNRNSVEFHAFASYLEKLILKNVFRGISVKDIAKGNVISLEKVTEREFGKKTYFFELKKIIKNNFSEKFIKKTGLEKDGAIASFAGYMLFANTFPNVCNKFKVPITTKILLNELREYSRDDVIRMKEIITNYETFLERTKKWKAIVKRSNLNRKKIINFNEILNFLNKKNKDLTVEFLIKQLKKDVKKLEDKNDEKQQLL